jgi:hypothetical protein
VAWQRQTIEWHIHSTTRCIKKPPLLLVPVSWLMNSVLPAAETPYGGFTEQQMVEWGMQQQHAGTPWDGDSGLAVQLVQYGMTSTQYLQGRYAILQQQAANSAWASVQQQQQQEGTQLDVERHSTDAGVQEGVPSADVVDEGELRLR